MRKMLLFVLGLSMLFAAFNGFFKAPLSRAMAEAGLKDEVHWIEGGYSSGVLCGSIIYAMAKNKKVVNWLIWGSGLMVLSIQGFGFLLWLSPTYWWILLLLRTMSGIVISIVFASVSEMYHRSLPVADNAHRLGIAMRVYLNVVIWELFGILGYWVIDREIPLIVWALCGEMFPLTIFFLAWLKREDLSREKRVKPQSIDPQLNGQPQINWYKLLLLSIGVLLPFAIVEELTLVIIPLYIESEWVKFILLGSTCGMFLGQLIAAMAPPKWNRQLIYGSLLVLTCSFVLLAITEASEIVFLALLLISMMHNMVTNIVGQTLFKLKTGKSLVIGIPSIVNGIGYTVATFGFGSLAVHVGYQAIWGCMLLLLPFSTTTVHYGRSYLKSENYSYASWIVALAIRYVVWRRWLTLSVQG
ncbi:Predicted arabinose efflux permease, MFS family [Seinonella peptonophila]|uniref:Predicted arabinose efflux permease, MFS family n=1 Tax=Seinonella peptonophila TaxID=112248 RepID=A0A1M4UAX1_9BACL|nr:hypothetical protein [Seinonella peptonophila]SHE53700.1 Predicted arabinose efflux permease, MFS family [Seinonella peptonophila]